MNLPKADTVEIAKEKITEYLLNPLHPDGTSKAGFFAAFGFTAEHWQELADSLRRVAGSCAVVKTAESAHGTKYVVDGPLATPAGRTPLVRTVWIVDPGTATPRLVTAYPHQQGD